MKTIGYTLLLLLIFPPTALCKKLPKNIWSYHYKKQMTQELCQDGGYYRSCFKVSKQQCKQRVSTSLAKCFKSKRLPSSIVTDRNGIRFGYDIGICVGKNLDVTLKNKRLSDKTCKEAWRWL